MPVLLWTFRFVGVVKQSWFKQQSFCYFHYGLGTILLCSSSSLNDSWSFTRTGCYHSTFAASLGIIMPHRNLRVLPVLLWTFCSVGVVEQSLSMQQSFCYFQYGLGTILHCPTLVLCESWSFARKGSYHSLFVASLGLVIDLYLLSILCVHHECILSLNKDYPIGELLAATFVDIWATPCHVLGYLTSRLCFTLGGLRSIRSFHYATSFAFLVFVDSILQTKPCCVNLCNVFAGVRIGEAKNPGPINRIRCAITNPTTVVSKIDQYTHLHKKESVTVSFLSETAATRLSQKVFNAKLRAHQLKAVWSLPVPDQFQRLDGRDSLKGKAAGVGFISSFPLRPAVGTFQL